MSLLVSHFVGKPKILLEIEKLDFEEHEENRLTELVTLLYHQKLLNRFLDNLIEEDKKIFLELMMTNTNEVYLQFLHQKIANLEEIVSSAVDEVEKQIQQDLESLFKE